MKVMSATLMCLALTAGSAAADDSFRSTMSGNVTIEIVPKDATTPPNPPKPGETLTIRVVQPAKPAEPATMDDEDIAQKLARCGAKWNDKLKDYEARLPKLRKYLAYRDKWEGYPAQQPPKAPEPLLTRAIYRSCIYACLEDKLAKCPGGWPEAKK